MGKYKKITVHPPFRPDTPYVTPGGIDPLPKEGQDLNTLIPPALHPDLKRFGERDEESVFPPSLPFVFNRYNYSPDLRILGETLLLQEEGYITTRQKIKGKIKSTVFTGWNADMGTRRNILRYLASTGDYPKGMLTWIGQRLSSPNSDIRTQAFMEMAAIAAMPRSGGTIEHILKKAGLSNSDSTHLWAFLDKAKTSGLSDTSQRAQENYLQASKELFEATATPDGTVNLTSDQIKTAYKASTDATVTADDYSSYVIKKITSGTDDTAYDVANGFWDNTKRYFFSQISEGFKIAGAITGLSDETRLGFNEDSEFTTEITLSVEATSSIAAKMWQDGEKFYQMIRNRFPGESEQKITDLAMAANLADKLHYHAPFYRVKPGSGGKIVEVTFRPSRIPFTIQMGAKMEREAITPYLTRLYKSIPEGTKVTTGLDDFEPVWTNSKRKGGEGGFFIRKKDGSFITDEDGARVIWYDDTDPNFEKAMGSWEEALLRIGEQGEKLRLEKEALRKSQKKQTPEGIFDTGPREHVVRKPLLIAYREDLPEDSPWRDNK